jgi:hypothetical protein
VRSAGVAAGGGQTTTEPRRGRDAAHGSLVVPSSPIELRGDATNLWVGHIRLESTVQCSRLTSPNVDDPVTLNHWPDHETPGALKPEFQRAVGSVIGSIVAPF